MTSSFAQFLASVEKKAYTMANIATRNPQDALDIVQDAMEKIVRNYRDKPYDEWQPLFFRILNNCIMDWHRKKKFRNLFFFWQQQSDVAETDSFYDVVMNEVDSDKPDELLIKSDDIDQMLATIELLPLKQQQCFLLRCWQGFSVAKTAQIMACSEGTVKTHYFRAVTKLKQQMETIDA